MVTPGHPSTGNVLGGPGAQNPHGPSGWESSKAQGENRADIYLWGSKGANSSKRPCFLGTRLTSNTERKQSVRTPLIPSPTRVTTGFPGKPKLSQSFPATMGSGSLNSPTPGGGAWEECRSLGGIQTPQPGTMTHMSLSLCQAYEGSLHKLCGFQ